MPETYADEAYRQFIREQHCALYGELDLAGHQHACDADVMACHLLPKNTHPDHGNLYPGCTGLHFGMEHQHGWREVWERYRVCLPLVCIYLYHKFLEDSGRWAA